MVPPILMETGKVKNPWPNVDAHSGVLLQVSVLISWKIITNIERQLSAAENCKNSKVQSFKLHVKCMANQYISIMCLCIHNLLLALMLTEELDVPLILNTSIQECSLFTGLTLSFMVFLNLP